MTTNPMVGAASGCEMPWHSIDWAKAHRTVRRLQMRMAKARRPLLSALDARDESSAIAGGIAVVLIPDPHPPVVFSQLAASKVPGHRFSVFNCP